jgi:hypothetical protein
MQDLKNIIADIQAHQDTLTGMKAVIARFHIGNKKVAEKIGAKAYKGSIATGWVTFLMPDNSSKFGSVASTTIKKTSITIDVSKEPLFFGICETLSFNEDDGEWKEFFEVPKIVTDTKDYFSLK